MQRHICGTLHKTTAWVVKVEGDTGRSETPVEQGAVSVLDYYIGYLPLPVGEGKVATVVVVREREATCHIACYIGVYIHMA